MKLHGNFQAEHFLSNTYEYHFEMSFHLSCYQKAFLIQSTRVHITHFTHDQALYRASQLTRLLLYSTTYSQPKRSNPTKYGWENARMSLLLREQKLNSSKCALLERSLLKIIVTSRLRAIITSDMKISIAGICLSALFSSPLTRKKTVVPLTIYTAAKCYNFQSG